MPLPIKFRSEVSSKLGIDESKQKEKVAQYQVMQEEHRKWEAEHPEELKWGTSKNNAIFPLQNYLNLSHLFLFQFLFFYL